MNISAFSERLKDLRIDAGMTSDQLAKKIGVTKKHNFVLGKRRKRA